MTNQSDLHSVVFDRAKYLKLIADLEAENAKLREAIDVALNAIDEWHHA